MLGSNLHQRRPRGQERTPEIEWRPSSALGSVDIEDRVKRPVPSEVEGRQAVSARLDFFCFGMKRSMKPVLKRPAWKSGSARIRW